MHSYYYMPKMPENFLGQNLKALAILIESWLLSGLTYKLGISGLYGEVAFPSK